jgi:hypothetical protein
MIDKMERVCKTCGTATEGSELFCRVCDTYLGWSVNADAPPEPEAPPEPPPDRNRDPSPDDGSGRSGGSTSGQAPPRVAPKPDRVVAPVASVKQAEVTVAPGAPGTFAIDLKNDSTIVESYLIHAAAPPDWLTVTHDEANLLPGVLRAVNVTFSVTPGVLAVAQRLTVPFVVRSGVDASFATQLSIDVVVPRSGPAATLTAQPNLIRLQDATEGSFRLRLDNTAANFPRQYRLTGTDPEGVVRLDFVPPAVDVPAGGGAEATVRFDSPAPAPGKDLSRQLTITATDDDGSVAVPVTIAQTTSPPPESLPVRLRLEPAQVTLVDTTTAQVNVVLDNRGGHETTKFTLSGRDPAGEIGFRFEYTRVAVQAGAQGYVRLSLQTTPAPRGGSDERPFTVVAVADDGREIETSGSLEVSSRPDPITVARLYVQPEHLVTTGRRGTFVVDVDNRQGAEPLNVQLSGADEFGRARITFQPAVLAVPPGQVARSNITVEHPRPEPGTPSTRKVLVRAASQTGAIDGSATFTQQSESYRRLWAVLLVLLGAAVMAVGWVIWARDDTVDGLTGAVRRLIDNAMDPSPPSPDDVLTASAALLLAMVLLSWLLMLLGLTGTGRLVRISAIFAVIWGGLVMLAAPIAEAVDQGVQGAGFSAGAFGLVVLGAAIGFTGGVLLKR